MPADATRSISDHITNRILHILKMFPMLQREKIDHLALSHSFGFERTS